MFANNGDPLGRVDLRGREGTGYVTDETLSNLAIGPSHQWSALGLPTDYLDLPAYSLTSFTDEPEFHVPSVDDPTLRTVLQNEYRMEPYPAGPVKTGVSGGAVKEFKANSYPALNRNYRGATSAVRQVARWRLGDHLGCLRRRGQHSAAEPVQLDAGAGTQVPADRGARPPPGC